MSSKLEQLKDYSQVVADTGDIEAIRKFRPTDATTNPSLLLKAVRLPHYRPLLQSARRRAAAGGGSSGEQLAHCCDLLAVDVGCRILELVPGRVSTETDARLAFAQRAIEERARKLIGLYEAQDIGRERILIKIAATWEGIRAAEQLEREGINCNLTLLFGFSQAVACADAGVYLISPFVGRILDWYKANSELRIESADDDPGVQSVHRIYQYYKRHGYQTVVMAASFRNCGEVEALAGCDRLTISPALLEQLAADHAELPRRLHPNSGAGEESPPPLQEAEFRYQLNADAMATEKLASGIRDFAADQVRLEQLLQDSGD